VEKPEGKVPHGRRRLEGMIILKWIFKLQLGGRVLDLSGSG
jgi:hypothetical protein